MEEGYFGCGGSYFWLVINQGCLIWNLWRCQENIVLFPFCGPVSYVHYHLYGVSIYFLVKLFYISRVGMELDDLLLGEVDFYLLGLWVLYNGKV